MKERVPEADADLLGPAARPIRRGFGLSWKLLLLTVVFVIATALLIYIPAIANFRVSWLGDRLAVADTATVVLAASTTTDLPREVQDELLGAVGAIAIAIKTGDVSRLIATVEMPPAVNRTVDLRQMDPVMEIVDAFDTLGASEPRVLRVV